MNIRSISKVFLLVLTILPLSLSRSAFQVAAGAISGVVTDPSGAAVPGAVIEATNLGRPDLLHHFAPGYSAFNHLRTKDARHGNQTLQIPGIDPDIPGFPRFNVSGAPTMGNTTSRPVDPAISDNFLFSDMVSWTHGRHQVKFGGEYWYQR